MRRISSMCPMGFIYKLCWLESIYDTVKTYFKKRLFWNLQNVRDLARDNQISENPFCC